MSNDTTSSGSNHIGAVQGTDPSQFSVGPPHVETSESAQSDKKPDADRDLESQLVDQTKTQIRTLVQEIAALSKSDCSQEDFFEGFLTRATSALASLGGAIWVRKTNEDPLKLNYHINLKQTNLATDKTAQRQHSLLINKLVEQGEPTIISPNSGGGDPAEAGNPTDRLLVFAPLRINNETVGLVEIFQRPNAGPSTQRGYLRFVSQMADLASDYLSNQRIKSFADQQSMWQQLEQFIRSVHQGLDTQQTIYTIANEGRRLTEADRVSVAIGKGRGCRVKAVSGLDSIERRAEQVKKLGELAATVIRTGQPLWYDGDDDDLPPQIEKRLHTYIDKSHCKMLAIIPLKESHAIDSQEEESRKSQSKPKVLGALIVEQLKDSRISTSLKQRTDVVVAHSQTALTNAIDHNSIFLMPLWKLLGKLSSAFRGGNLLKTLGIVGCLIGVAAFLTLFPYPFALGAKGSLTPETQHEVFAQVDGVLQEVYVSDTGETFVEKGQLLARMKNNDLLVAIENLTGKIAESATTLESSRTLRASGHDLSQIEKNSINNEISLAQQTINSLNRELRLKQEEAMLLDIVSPSAGQVVNWQVRQNLLRRPVVRGQNLMTIVDPNTQWQIELEMPERRLAHLIKEMESKENDVEVTFGLVSHPGTEYVGKVLKLDRQLDVHSDEGNSALVRISFQNDTVNPDLLRAGTRVTAKIHCGQRSIGYVMFHELIETVQSSFLFWL